MPPSAEDSQRTIVPICPLKVNDPLFEVAHTAAAAGAIAPPTEAGVTVTVTGVEFAAEQTPL